MSIISKEETQEMDANQAFYDFVDTYKDVHGIKPRWLSPDMGSSTYWLDETAKLLKYEAFLMQREQELEQAFQAWKVKVTDPTPLFWKPFQNLVSLAPLSA